MKDMIICMMERLDRSMECYLNRIVFIKKFQVITIFSASNYYEIGSNKGAYLKLNPQLDTHFVSKLSFANCYILIVTQTL